MTPVTVADLLAKLTKLDQLGPVVVFNGYEHVPAALPELKPYFFRGVYYTTAEVADLQHSYDIDARAVATTHPPVVGIDEGNEPLTVGELCEHLESLDHRSIVKVIDGDRQGDPAPPVTAPFLVLGEPYTNADVSCLMGDPQFNAERDELTYLVHPVCIIHAQERTW